MPEDAIQFHVINFFHVFLTNQTYNMNITGEIGFVRALLRSMHAPKRNNEKVQRKKWNDAVEAIWEKTNEEINTKITFVELAYNKNVQRGLNKQVEIEDNDGDSKDYNTAQLYSHLKSAESILVEIVVIIAGIYNVSVPMSNRGNLHTDYGLKSALS